MDLPSLTISNSVCRKLVNSTSAPDAIGPYNQVNIEAEPDFEMSWSLGFSNDSHFLLPIGFPKAQSIFWIF